MYAENQIVDPSPGCTLRKGQASRKVDVLDMLADLVVR